MEEVIRVAVKTRLAERQDWGGAAWGGCVCKRSVWMRGAYDGQVCMSVLASHL